MKNEEKLYLAIGEIDESLIKEASEKYNKLNFTAIKKIAVAASVAMIFLITVLGAVNVIFNDNSHFGLEINGAASDGASKPMQEEDDAFDGAMDHSEFGRFMTDLELTEELKIKFHLSVISDECTPIDIILFGRYYNEFGEVEYALCATAPNPSGYNIVLKPSYTVNGIPSDSLPTQRGEYDITVDFTVINDYDVIWNEKITIDGRESFKIK